MPGDVAAAAVIAAAAAAPMDASLALGGKASLLESISAATAAASWDEDGDGGGDAAGGAAAVPPLLAPPLGFFSSSAARARALGVFLNLGLSLCAPQVMPVWTVPASAREASRVSAPRMMFPVAVLDRAVLIPPNELADPGLLEPFSCS